MNDMRHDPNVKCANGRAPIGAPGQCMRLTPAPGGHPEQRDLRTIDEREADDVAALTARIETLEAQLARLSQLLDVRL